MKRLYITFGGAAYDRTTEKIFEAMRGPKFFGFDSLKVYDDRWLVDQEFYRLNKWLWSYPQTDDPNLQHRGFGWFCWKPYIIMHALDNFCQDGDIVLYTDADTFPIAPFGMIYDECARIGGTMLFNAYGCDNVNWCKEDCRLVMGDWPEFHGHKTAGVARFMLFQKGPWKVRQFLMEWLTYCLNPLATSFNPSVIRPDSPELNEHRTEQAIMTLLAYKYGHKLYREACQYGATHPEDQELYGQLFTQIGCHQWAKTLEGSRFRNV
jgi:hypothetical protein